MPIDLSAISESVASLPQRPDGYVILALYALAVFFALLATHRSFRGLGRRRWGVFALLLIAGFVLNGVLLFSPVGAPPGIEASAVPMLGLLSLLLAGAWVGTGPAILVGLASGAARWLLAGGRITHPAELALFGWLAAWLMQQDYQGWLADFVRRPIVAGLLAALFGWLLAFPSLYATAPGSALAALDYALSAFWAAGPPILIEGGLNALLAQLACLAFPSLRPVSTGGETPFYAQSLNRRLLWTILPLVFLTITAQIVIVGATALEEANRQAVNRLASDAKSAVALLDSFFVEGQAVLSQFAEDDRLRDPSDDVRQARLASAISTVAFFDEMLLLDLDNQVINHLRVRSDATSASPETGDAELTSQEIVLLERVEESGAPQQTGVHKDAGDNSLISFLQPIRSESGPYGVLIGRTRLTVNPIIDAFKRNLFDLQERSVGYLVDDNNRIIVHPEQEQELSQWVFDTSQPAYAVTPGDGRAYISLSKQNVRQFIFVQKVSGTPWTVTIELPYSNILRTAAQISAPLVLMLVVIMLGALVLLPLISQRVTRPIGMLVQEVSRISRGELDRPVMHTGEDEVGRLSGAFEVMRQSLKARMDDLRLLLRVSGDVATSLDLERGIPPILDGAMQVSAQQSASAPARVARVIVFDDYGRPERVIARGDGPATITPLDAELARVTPRDERPLLVENVARPRGALDPNLVGPGVKSIAALSLRRQNQTLGVMWLGYPAPRPFAESETDLLVTLAGQAAVFIENVRLFEAAEGGRKRLQAVLSSTNDAVIVTNQDNRLLLCNPAAEIAFGIPPQGGVGRMVNEVIPDPSVVNLLTETDEAATRTAEVSLPDGRTLYASASSIVASDEQRIGRVAVLRDITHLKELDSLKSEFVATVSHDLRAPLTYIRGYVTMIPMVGPVLSKQQDYLDKIMGGVEHMTALIDDLLDLGRIEAGVGIVREPVSLAHIAQEALEIMQPQALSRNLTLKLDRLEDCTVQGDRQLLKHAISNLIDNAIKYTFNEGQIRVGVNQRDGKAVVHVSDNGIGIAPADQARLFEKFYRVKRRDTLDIKGTGLGLAIVKSVAEWHNGRVWVESQLGKGSTFYLEIPIER